MLSALSIMNAITSNWGQEHDVNDIYGLIFIYNIEGSNLHSSSEIFGVNTLHIVVWNNDLQNKNMKIETLYEIFVIYNNK